MPKEKIVSTDGLTVYFGWTKGGEASIDVDAGSAMTVSKPITLAELEELESTLRKIRKQVFDVTALDVLLESKVFTEIMSNNPSRWESNSANLFNRVKRVPCDKAVASISEVPGFAASWVYLREKNCVSPSTFRLDKLAKGSKEHSASLEQSLLRDACALESRMDMFAELVLRSALYGRISIEHRDIVTEVDYNFVSPYKTPSWKDSSLSDIKKDVERMKVAFYAKNEKMPTDVYTDKETIDLLQAKNSVLIKTNVPNSEAYTESYDHRERVWIRSDPNQPDTVEFEDMVWHSTDIKASNNKGEIETISPGKGKVAFMSWDGDPLLLLEGPSYDFAAPENHAGKFFKGWREKDPGSCWILCEYSFMPIWRNKNQVMILDIS